MPGYFINKSSYLISFSTEKWVKSHYGCRDQGVSGLVSIRAEPSFGCYASPAGPVPLRIQTQTLVILSQLLGRPNPNIRHSLGESCHSRFANTYSWNDPWKPFFRSMWFLPWFLDLMLQCYIRNIDMT